MSEVKIKAEASFKEVEIMYETFENLQKLILIANKDFNSGNNDKSIIQLSNAKKIYLEHGTFLI